MCVLSRIVRVMCWRVRRYAEFLTQLGTLVSLEGGDDDQPHLFLNLEKGGKDGHYTYVWNDDIMQVTLRHTVPANFYLYRCGNPHGCPPY